MLSLLPRLPVGHIRARSLAKARTAPAGGFNPPYSLPTAGNAVAIGTNDFLDIVPAALATAEWNSIVWQSFGAGTFVQSYSTGGAYIAGAGGGGHTDGRSYGGGVFDFTDETWKRLDATNTGATYSTTNHATSATSGASYYEITGSSGCPAAAHLYGTQVELSTALGGGARGSLLFVTRAAVCIESVTSSGLHRAALGANDLTWSRYTDNTSARATAEQTGVLDAARSRVWVIPFNLEQYTSVLYFDLTDSTFKTLGSFTAPAGTSEGPGCAFMHDGYVIRRGTTGTWWLFDPDTPNSGWQSLTVSGTQPATAHNKPAPYGGKFYWMPNGGGTTLTRLTPPTPVSGTWAFDTVTVGGATIPAHTSAVGHYSSFCYVPAINCCAWFAGNANNVIILKPE